MGHLLPVFFSLWLLALPGLAEEGHGSHGGNPALKTKTGLAMGAALSPDGVLWITGLDEEAHLFVQHSDDLGQHWSARQVLDIGGDTVSADGENRPKLAFAPDGRMVLSYTHPLAKPYSGEIRLLRSSDGRQFSAPATVHHDSQVITHRFDSIAFDRSGTLHTVWIDKRDQILAPGRYRGAAIYRNESRDGGASFGPDIKLADHSCECCHIALAPAPGGGMAALWRHVFAPNFRDHAFALLGQEKAEPVRASEDNWALDACPHHGPGLAPAADGGYHAVWFGQRQGRMAVRYGRLQADGRPFGPVRELPDPGAEHADVASQGKQVVIAWRSFDGQQTRLRAWVSDDEGKHFSLRELAASSTDNDHPRLLATPRGVLVLWRSREALQVIAPFSSPPLTRELRTGAANLGHEKSIQAHADANS